MMSQLQAEYVLVHVYIYIAFIGFIQISPDNYVLQIQIVMLCVSELDSVHKTNTLKDMHMNHNFISYGKVCP